MVISTGDKDLAQLVGPNVLLVNTASSEVLDEAGVLAGWRPARAHRRPPGADWRYRQTTFPASANAGRRRPLNGWRSTARSTIWFAHADEVGGVVGENLRQALGFLPLGRRWLPYAATLRLPETPQSLTPRPPQRERLIELFTRIESKSWLREATQLPEIPAAGSEATTRVEEAATRWQCRRHLLSHPCPPSPTRCSNPIAPATRRCSTGPAFDRWLAGSALPN